MSKYALNIKKSGIKQYGWITENNFISTPKLTKADLIIQHENKQSTLGQYLSNEYSPKIKHQGKNLKEQEQKPLEATQTAVQANNEDLTGLDKHNYDKAKAKSMANIVAEFLWSMDTNKKIKIGDMVQQLKPLLSEFDVKAMPETDNTIKDWIRDNAPDYAKEAGRPPSDDEKEIILTMKK